MIKDSTPAPTKTGFKVRRRAPARRHIVGTVPSSMLLRANSLMAPRTGAILIIPSSASPRARSTRKNGESIAIGGGQPSRSSALFFIVGSITTQSTVSAVPGLPSPKQKPSPRFTDQVRNSFGTTLKVAIVGINGKDANITLPPPRRISKRPAQSKHGFINRFGPGARPRRQRLTLLHASPQSHDLITSRYELQRSMMTKQDTAKIRIRLPRDSARQSDPISASSSKEMLYLYECTNMPYKNLCRTP